MKNINKYLLTLPSLLICFWANAQSQNEIFSIPPNPNYITIASSETNNSPENIKLLLEKKYLNHEFNNQSLQLQIIKNSPIGTHYRFAHFLNGKEVLQSFLQANFDYFGKLYLVINNLATFEKILDSEPLVNEPTYWLNTNLGLTKVYKIIKHDSIKNTERINYYDSKNRLVKSIDPLLYKNGPDTMVTAMVYLPNPMVATNSFYGGGYIDNADKNSTELSNARSLVRLKVKYDKGVFLLTDGLIQLKNLHDPAIKPIEPIDTFFNFTRDQAGFEDINAYYHIKFYSDYLRKIGFSQLLDSVIIDPHGASGADNSFLDPQTFPFQIEYGTGGVDDAEDGQVIVHEFGHSLSVIASFGTVDGNERLAMEEGQADYICMSYSRSLSNNRRNDVFSWDGHNEFWDGFKTNTKGLYKNLSGIKDVDRELWSTALLCIHDKLRSSQSDSLILSSYFLQAINAKMPQMARVILKLDSMLFKGKDVAKIWQCFTDRGILDTVPSNLIKISNINFKENIKIYNTTGFSNGLGPIRLDIINPEFWQQIVIVNQLGQLVKNIEPENEIFLSPEQFTPGLYLIKIVNKYGYEIVTKKIIRF